MLSVRTCVQNLPRTAPHPHTPRLIFPTTLGSGCAHFLFIGKTDAQKSAYGQQLVSVRTRCVWGGNAKKHLKSWFNYPKYRRSQIDPSDAVSGSFMHRDNIHLPNALWAPRLLFHQLPSCQLSPDAVFPVANYKWKTSLSALLIFPPFPYLL